MSNAPVPSPPRSERRVLVVEDDDDLRDLLLFNLQQQGYEARACPTGEDGLREYEEFKAHVVLLDLMLPGIQGTDVCRRLRSMSGEQPAIVMLTARNDEIDRVVGFEVGADDYVAKPFSVRELMLRVRSMFNARRWKGDLDDDSAPNRFDDDSSDLPEHMKLAEIEIDVRGHHVYVQSKKIALSMLEMRLLIYLMQGDGKVCPRDKLLADVWGYQKGISTRTVDTHIKRLRDKLGVAGYLIQTVRGLGYRLSE